MVGRASIVGAVETNVGKVRDHNEDSSFIDPDGGIFIVCDGMGGHAAGEVASAIAVQTIRSHWSSREVETIADRWLTKGTPDAHRQLMTALQAGVLAAHQAILAEASHDRSKGGMGTTVVGAMVVGADVLFAHCGDSRAYLVRDGIAMQLTEDHTLAARLLAAGVDLDVEGDGARFKSMLTNALGIGQECKVSMFVVPLADGDRFLLCSDGITEYVKEAEVGEVLCGSPSPARAAQRLVELALERGGGDNATAMVVRVLEAGETARPAELMRRDETVLRSCPLLEKLTPQQRLRALRIALPRDHAGGERIPAQALGDRVAWIIMDGELEQGADLLGPGALLYPEALLPDRPLPDKHGLAVARRDVRALAVRADDFGELCEDDPDLAEALTAALAAEMAARADAAAPPGPAAATAAAPEPEQAMSSVPIAVADEPTPVAGAPELAPVAAAPAAPVVAPVRAPVAPPAQAVPQPTDAAYAATPPGGVPAPGARPAGKRGPTPPLGTRQLPKLPPLGQIPKIPKLGGTPRAAAAPGLIVPPAARADADTSAAIDKALDEISVDRGWAELDEPDEPAPAPVLRAPPAGDASEPEIIIERPIDDAAPRTRALEDDSAKLIEIVEGGISEPALVISEPPEPEVLVIERGRPITAGDTSVVAGTIDHDED